MQDFLQTTSPIPPFLQGRLLCTTCPKRVILSKCEGSIRCHIAETQKILRHFVPQNDTNYETRHGHPDSEASYPALNATNIAYTSGIKKAVIYAPATAPSDEAMSLS